MQLEEKLIRLKLEIIVEASCVFYFMQSTLYSTLSIVEAKAIMPLATACKCSAKPISGAETVGGGDALLPHWAAVKAESHSQSPETTMSSGPGRHGGREEAAAAAGVGPCFAARLQCVKKRWRALFCCGSYSNPSPTRLALSCCRRLCLPSSSVAASASAGAAAGSSKKPKVVEREIIVREHE